MQKPSCRVAVLALCACALLPAGDAAAAGTTRIVDDDGRASSVSCEAANPAPRSIQAAIDLSVSGDTILVCPGVYEEQLKIVSKDLTIRGVTSGELNQVLIRPDGVIANSTNAFSGVPIAAVVAVEGSANVVLRGLTIDGSDNRLTACDPTLVGVFYRNASGEVQASAVRGIRLGSTLGYCQSGFGIFAQSGDGGAAKLTVSSSSVHDYQKVGIIANEVGTVLQAEANAVAGDGATPAIAQNGIQIGFGAVGSILRNSVVNHVFTCPTFPCDASSNILIFEASKVKVRGNRTAKASIGIYLVRSDDSEVRNNKVSDTDVFDGIAVIGSRNHIHLNSIVNSDEFALYVDGTDNLVEKNVLNEAPCGIFASGTGNNLTGNTIYNTELATCEPFTLMFQALSLDARTRSPLMSGLILRNAATASSRDSSGTAGRDATPAR